MPQPETREPQTESPEIILDRWKDRLKTLMDEVRGWVERHGWRTRTIEKPVDDRRLGRHTVNVLLMEKDTIEVALNPVSPLVPGAEGAVDLYLVPAYDDIASLYLEDGRWMIHYVFAHDAREAYPMSEVEPLPLSEGSIVRVLGAISSHAS